MWSSRLHSDVVCWNSSKQMPWTLLNATSTDSATRNRGHFPRGRCGRRAEAAHNRSAFLVGSSIAAKCAHSPTNLLILSPQCYNSPFRQWQRRSDQLHFCILTQTVSVSQGNVGESPNGTSSLLKTSIPKENGIVFHMLFNPNNQQKQACDSKKDQGDRSKKTVHSQLVYKSCSDQSRLLITLPTNN